MFLSQDLQVQLTVEYSPSSTKLRRHTRPRQNAGEETMEERLSDALKAPSRWRGGGPAIEIVRQPAVWVARQCDVGGGHDASTLSLALLLSACDVLSPRLCFGHAAVARRRRVSAWTVPTIFGT